ncbi:hypothetical protein E2C01_089518 [Portunus trituberculatus]|uniref:Uncharacterized protein n=1 Tax=Portunus trituberculatus TaxID=210409 RepID=A0A5B7JDR7_PORTR|nr:hypothetical protein [Portunus trituberculatus]
MLCSIKIRHNCLHECQSAATLESQQCSGQRSCGEKDDSRRAPKYRYRSCATRKTEAYIAKPRHLAWLNAPLLVGLLESQSLHHLTVEASGWRSSGWV